MAKKLKIKLPLRTIGDGLEHNSLTEVWKMHSRERRKKKAFGFIKNFLKKAKL